jgi:cytochrome c biogenesis protein
MKLKILRLIAQLNFAILLLLIIAGFSILGTIIEQDQALEYYGEKYSNTSFLNIFTLNDLLLFFGINHIYKTWWFLSLLFLFALSLISCSYIQQFPSLKLARRCDFKFNFNKFKTQEYFSILNKNSFFRLLNKLKSKKYNIFHQKMFVYIYKGILGRFAPIIVHFSMILILFGNTITAFGSFNSQELIAKGEIFHIQNLSSKTFFANIFNYPIRVNDFWVEYNTKNNVNQFYSNLSILDEIGNEISRKTISVNLPLQYKAFTFYQTDWNITGLRIFFFNQIYEIPIFSLDKTKIIWISWIPDLISSKNGLIFITNNLNGNFSLYNSFGNFLGTFNLNSKIENLNYLNIIELITETGLQIKADPGIPFIFLGFFILMLSTLISYFSFTQLWLLQNQETVLIGATSNRAKLNLRIEFLGLSLEHLI